MNVEPYFNGPRWLKTSPRASLGREPLPGDRCELSDLNISVLEAEGFRVRWVLVQIPIPEVEELEAREALR